MEQRADQLADLRVILVGPTGLDAALRRDPGLELIRARTPLDALGELADPMDPANPGRAVVIIDPLVEPAPTDAQGTGDLAEFLAGLRRVDPAVRVLRVARNGNTIPAGYDGQVEPKADASALRRFIEQGSTPPPPRSATPPPLPVPAPAPKPLPHPIEAIEPKPAPPPLPTPEPAPTPIATPVETPPPPPPPIPLPSRITAIERAAPADPTDEVELLRLLSAGQPVLDAALALLRVRVECDDLTYRTQDQKTTDTTHGSTIAHSAAPVCVGDETIGELLSRSLPPATLAPAAVWLGAWLDLEHQQHTLREAAFRDPLTGAWNRRHFDEFLPEAIEEARAARRSLTVLLFDIDDFKRFNDEHGHAAGDEILTECVRLLDTAVRPTDKVCRIGGDEFAVIFYEPEGPRDPSSHHPTSVFDIAERFRSLVCEARFRKLADDAPGHLTISGGLATYPWDGHTAATLVERADMLALEGKKQGKNVIAIGPGCDRLNAEDDCERTGQS